MLIQPTGGHWKEGAIEKIKELIGEKVVRKKGPFSFLTDNFITKELQHSLNELNAQLTGTARPELEDAHGSESEGGNSLSSLTPGQKGLVEAMELKISKIGFKTKLRALYLAQKENFHPERAVNALVGAMSQYNIPTSNSLIPKKDTSDNNPKKAEKKKTEMLKLYKKRKISSGANAFVLNIEELATIWHFPMSHVMTPRVQMAAIKQAEPPSGLPIEVLSNSISDLPESPPKSASSTDMDAFHFPPYMTDSGDTAHHHDSDFG